MTRTPTISQMMPYSMRSEFFRRVTNRSRNEAFFGEFRPGYKINRLRLRSTQKGIILP